MRSIAFLSACVVAALVSISQPAVGHHVSPNSLVSPCPELFHYEMMDKPGQWTGRLNLKSEFDIKGIWIRLMFDKEIKDLTVDGDFIVKQDDDKKMAKVQNGNQLLEAKTVKILKITVTYDGTEAPRLIEYRLNARTICPQANINRYDVFLGDSKSDFFLPSLKNLSEITLDSPKYKCGISHSTNPHPWQASLLIHTEKEKERYSCDATLITPNYVITAAHCVTFQKENTVIPSAFLSIRLGPVGATRSLVADIKVHPGYASGYLFNDVAILKLASPIDISDDLRPVCVGGTPEKDTRVVIVGREEDGNEGRIGKILESNAWGIDKQECETIAPQLQGVLTNDTCCSTYKPDEKYCAGNSGSGVIATGDRAQLLGFVNLGLRLQKQQNGNECDPKNAVILVANIDKHLSWIRNIVY